MPVIEEEGWLHTSTIIQTKFYYYIVNISFNITNTHKMVLA